MKNKSFLQSFRHASDGFFHLIKTERNMRVHAVMTVLVILCSVIFNLTAVERVIVIFLCGSVISAELINTAIENAVDLSCSVFNMYAKRAKDLASAAVMVSSVFAAVCGLIIFVPYGIRLLMFLIERI